MKATIGNAVRNIHSDLTGYVYSVEESKDGAFLMVGGPAPMSEIKQSIKVVYPSTMEGRGHIAELDEYSFQRQYLPDAESISEGEALAMVDQVKQAQAEYQQLERDKREEQKRAREEWNDKYRAKVPSTAKAVIVARYHESTSDPMTDYFGHTTSTCLVLAFSKHTRDLFPEMRKAAANAEETKHLSLKPEAPEGADEWWTPDDEHREKYSMGGGYYLGVYRHHSGWVVSKERISAADIESLPMGEWRIPEASAQKRSAKPAQTCSTGSSYSIEEHTHTKKGFQFFIVVMNDRVERDRFLELKAAAIAAGGWYSRQWGKTPGGFAFEEEEAAKKFAADNLGGDSSPDPEPQKPKSGKPEKMRNLAKRLEQKAAEKLSDRLENTAKRIAQAGSARVDGFTMKRAAELLLKLADMIEADKVPEELRGVTTKAEAMRLAKSKTEQTPNGFYSYPVELNEPAQDTPEYLAAWSILDNDKSQIKETTLKVKLSEVALSKIPGYFPTPPEVVQRMLEAAEVSPLHSVLEPSAGGGAIIEQLPHTQPENEAAANVVCVMEINPTLCEVLRLRGFDARPTDFLEMPEPGFKFDRILMNPPFEKQADIQHIKHAFSFLATGGRLIAISSPSWQWREDRKALDFKCWLQSVGGVVEELPPGSFKQSGTAVNTVLITIEKGEL
mgnify:CR=1 FL=1